MAVKYVKDFAFDSGFGFTGSKGATPVRAYMRGGAVKKAAPKAPSIAPAMVEKRSQGLGGLAKETKKLAPYNKPHMEGKKGAKVATYAKGGAVKKAHAKKEMPSFLKAKMMKKAQGGPVAEITEGDGMSPLQMMQQEDPPLKPLPPDDPRLLPSLPMKPLDDGELEFDIPGSGKSDRVDYDPGNRNRDFLRQLLERDTERMRGDAAQQMLEMPSRPGYGPDLGGRRMLSIGDLTSLPEEPNYVGPAPYTGPTIAEEDPNRYREMIADMQRSVQVPSASAPMMERPEPIGLGPMKPGVSAPRLPMAGEPGFGTSKGLRPSPLAAAARMAPQDRRAMRADRNEMARDIMDRYIAGPRRAMGARGIAESRARRVMPVAPSEPMIQIPRAPRGGVMTYAKGGKVSKGEKKIGKVMGEFKRGELHSGSKKGPVVTNPKQATAIALSEARAAGAKIPKKAMGGKACG